MNNKTNEIVIEKAKESDAKAIAKVKRMAWETTYRGIYPDEKIDGYDFEKQEQKFKVLINDKNQHFYVAKFNNEIVGYMCAGKLVREFKDYDAEIMLLYILKEFQGQGLGKRFFLVAKQCLEKDGHKRFFISCNKYNLPAQAFYKKMGGKVVFVDEDNLDRSIPQIKFEYEI